MVEFDVPRKDNVLISLTPLIDVVFILLVFFMLATNFTQWHTIDLFFGEPTNVVNLQKKATLIKVGDKDKLIVNGVTHSVVDIEKILESKLLHDPSHGVLLQPADDVPLQDIVSLMGKLRYLVGDNISLANGADE